MTRRWYDPYGNPVGTTPAAFADGDKGFVGGTTDTATGLVNLGAREYQAATGSFVSPDSVLKPLDPQDLNPYAYAEDDPASHSDPTGDDIQSQRRLRLMVLILATHLTGSSRSSAA